MEKIIRPPDEVETFLNKVKELITDDEKVIINSESWAGGRANKTRQYMAETGIHKETIEDVVREFEKFKYTPLPKVNKELSLEKEEWDLVRKITAQR